MPETRRKFDQDFKRPRAGTIELAILKLRQGSCFPEYLEQRRRAERALASVVATGYLLGVPAPAGGEAGRLAVGCCSVARSGQQH